jgi:uncharacterized membrane protein
LWGNLHLMVWLSLVPFVTAWMGMNRFATWPVALYGTVLLMSGVAYYILSRSLIRHHGPDSALAIALGKDVKGKASVIVYAVAIPLSFLNRWVALGAYIAVAVAWLIPDPRIEKTLTS